MPAKRRVDLLLDAAQLEPLPPVPIVATTVETSPRFKRSSRAPTSIRPRALHATVVERQIGYKGGTGGSTGVNYLRSRRDLRFYPLLWELRTAL